MRYMFSFISVKLQGVILGLTETSTKDKVVDVAAENIEASTSVASLSTVMVWGGLGGVVVFLQFLVI